MPSKHLPKFWLLKDFWHSCWLHSLIFSYQLEQSRSAGPQGEIKHPAQTTGQVLVASAKAFQCGFGSFHFMQETVELGQC